MVFISTNTKIVKAEGTLRIRESVVFDQKLSDDKSGPVPIVRVTSDDYTDGSSTIQEYSFPEAMIKIPENSSFEKNDKSKPDNLRTGCGISPYSLMFQLSTGYTAYHVECYGTYSNQTGTKTRPGDYKFKKVYIYSFESNKQIAAVNDHPRHGNPIIGNYDRALDDNAILLEEYNTINGTRSKFTYFQLYPDGHKTEVFLNPHLGSWLLLDK